MDTGNIDNGKFSIRFAAVTEVVDFTADLQLRTDLMRYLPQVRTNDVRYVERSV